MERVEGDARAERGYSERTVDDAREKLYAWLYTTPEREVLDPFTADLNDALGVSRG